MPAPCPTSAELQQFCAGNLDEQSLSQVASHVDDVLVQTSSCKRRRWRERHDSLGVTTSSAVGEFFAEAGCQKRLTGRLP